MKTCKILIVDDDATLALLLEARLKAADYDVRIADTAAEAYRTFLTFKPHLLLTDISIGNENGLDLVKRIRSRGDNIRTIYMTGDLDGYRSALAKEKQSYHAEVIAKPFNAEELIAVVSAQARGQQTAA